MKRIFIYLFLFLAISCQENQPPECTILSPSNGASFNIGDIIPVSVDADDPEGNIDEVKIFLNQIGVVSLSNFPFNHNISTSDLISGEYTLRATASDIEGLETSDEISFSINASLPSVSIKSIDSLTNSSAFIEGEVLNDGGETISARGFCWNTLPNPTISNNYIAQGTGLGEFNGKISNLLCNTEYYVRAYATNSQGTSYSEQLSFSTGICYALPTISTSSAGSITDSSAVCGGHITYNGGANIRNRGVCWSTSQNPTTLDNHTSDGAGGGTFSSTITGLECETTYFVRAYASNVEGTSYGEEVSFITNNCQASIPAVSTEPISDIASESVTGGGNVTDNGGAQVTARGVCWSVSMNPTLSDNYTTDGSGAGSYTSAVTGLTCETTYYLRAFATNSAGTSYGDQISFTTATCPVELPTVLTIAISDITAISAQSGGNIENNGGASINVRGVCWSTAPNPTISDNKTVDGTGTGSYTSTITGLTCGTTYYVRAYATNSEGTAYGMEESFTTTSCPNLPTVETSSINSITMTMAQGGGNVTDDGGAEIIAKGICWSITQNTTISDSKTDAGSGSGSFTGVLTGLTCETTYYTRAFATNNVGTSYGNEISFTTSTCLTIPIVSTVSVSNITDTEALSGGNIISDGGSDITAKGVCWSTTSNPTLSDEHSYEGTGNTSYQSNLSELAPKTTFYIRAYATNSEGTGYGNEMVLTTWEGSVTDYDGNIYKTVAIGNQTWMAENLYVTHFPDGTSIPFMVSGEAWDALDWSDKAYGWYENDPLIGEIYGALYSWHAAKNGAHSSDSNPSGVQGVCPDGWHFPSDPEWAEMVNYLGGPETAGGLLKESGTSHWDSPNAGATNSSGFTALPAGYIRFSPNFYSLGTGGYFWTATGLDEGYGILYGLRHDNTKARRDPIDSFSDSGFSVRCVKDTP